MRQIPYTMMKFACFERTVEALYKYVVPKPRSECTKGEQLVVTFVAGYIGKESLKSYTSLMDYCNSRDLLASLTWENLLATSKCVGEITIISLLGENGSVIGHYS